MRTFVSDMSVPTNTSQSQARQAKHISLVDILFFHCPLYFPSHLISDSKECIIRPRTNQRPKCQISKPKQNKKLQKTNRAHFKTRCLTEVVTRVGRYFVRYPSLEREEGFCLVLVLVLGLGLVRRRVQKFFLFFCFLFVFCRRRAFSAWVGPFSL